MLVHQVNLIHFFIKLCHKMLLAHKINGKYSILLYIDLIKSNDIFCNRTVKELSLVQIQLNKELNGANLIY